MMVTKFEKKKSTIIFVDFLQVKLDELVKPEKEVADYRTNITGVSAKDLEQVTCSLQDVQVRDFLKGKIVKSETIW